MDFAVFGKTVWKWKWKNGKYKDLSREILKTEEDKSNGDNKD